MMKTIQNRRILASLALIGAIAAHGREARADVGSSVVAAKAINISGTYSPETGDPPYDYSFTLDLNSGTIASGFSFTIDDLPGVTRHSVNLPGTSSPSTDWSITITYEGQDPSDHHLVLSDVTWTYTGPDVSAPLVITPFDVETTQSLHTPPAISVGYSYKYSVNDQPVNDNLTLTAATPEPSSAAIVLVIGGLATGSGLVARARRRRSAGTA